MPPRREKPDPSIKYPVWDRVEKKWRESKRPPSEKKESPTTQKPDPSIKYPVWDRKLKVWRENKRPPKKDKAPPKQKKEEIKEFIEGFNELEKEFNKAISSMKGMNTKFYNKAFKEFTETMPKAQTVPKEAPKQTVASVGRGAPKPKKAKYDENTIKELKHFLYMMDNKLHYRRLMEPLNEIHSKYKEGKGIKMLLAKISVHYYDYDKPPPDYKIDFEKTIIRQKSFHIEGDRSNEEYKIEREYDKMNKSMMEQFIREKPLQDPEIIALMNKINNDGTRNIKYEPYYIQEGIARIIKEYNSRYSFKISSEAEIWFYNQIKDKKLTFNYGGNISTTARNYNRELFDIYPDQDPELKLFVCKKYGYISEALEVLGITDFYYSGNDLALVNFCFKHKTIPDPLFGFTQVKPLKYLWYEGEQPQAMSDEERKEFDMFKKLVSWKQRSLNALENYYLQMGKVYGFKIAYDTLKNAGRNSLTVKQSAEIDDFKKGQTKRIETTEQKGFDDIMKQFNATMPKEETAHDRIKELLDKRDPTTDNEEIEDELGEIANNIANNWDKKETRDTYNKNNTPVFVWEHITHTLVNKKTNPPKDIPRPEGAMWNPIEYRYIEKPEGEYIWKKRDSETIDGVGVFTGGKWEERQKEKTTREGVKGIKRGTGEAPAKRTVEGLRKGTVTKLDKEEHKARFALKGEQTREFIGLMADRDEALERMKNNDPFVRPYAFTTANDEEKRKETVKELKKYLYNIEFVTPRVSIDVFNSIEKAFKNKEPIAVLVKGHKTRNQANHIATKGKEPPANYTIDFDRVRKARRLTTQ